jgi:hypothetical protein
MSSRLILAAIAALGFAAPAFAQTAPATAPSASATAAPAPAPTEAEIEAAGDAFGSDMEAMSAELEAAKTAAGADTAKANADADAIVAKYQPKADAFVVLVSAFMEAQGAPAEAIQGLAQLKTVPKQVRDSVMAPAPTE